MSNIRTFNPEGHSPFAPTYSHVSAGHLSSNTRIIHLAGQIGVDSRSGDIPSAFIEQVKLALSNVDKCLSAANAGKESIIHVRQFVVGLGKMSAEEKGERGKVYSEWIGGSKPPSTLLGVEALAANGLLYEIEVVALVD